MIVAMAVLGLAACADDQRPATAMAPAASAQAGSQYDKPGFWTKVEHGRLWVFRAGSKELEAFQKSGEPARQVTRIGAGPGGMTIKSSDASVIDGYIAAK
ncbi:hypothetical protein STVA_02620 [Allostella vacuolata]|nr:hypothetical protein STVA_02620 [Stella vacuolata]